MRPDRGIKVVGYLDIERGRQAKAPGGEPIDPVPLDIDRPPRVEPGADDLLRQPIIDAAHHVAPLRLVERAARAALVARQRRADRPRHVPSRRLAGAQRPGRQGAQASRIGGRKIGFHRHGIKARRELVGVDALHHQPRAIGLAHAQQQPGALRRPVCAIDPARRIGRAQQRAPQEDGGPARHDRRMDAAHQRGEILALFIAKGVRLEPPRLRRQRANAVQGPARAVGQVIFGLFRRDFLGRQLVFGRITGIVAQRRAQGGIERLHHRHGRRSHWRRRRRRRRAARRWRSRPRRPGRGRLGRIAKSRRQ